LLPQVGNYNELLRDRTCYIDVRAEGEFARGTLSCAYNLPILNDEERSRVGTCYKSNGPEAATALGHKLVNGAVRDTRIAAWQAQAERAAREGQPCVIMCWRGGQRSSLAQQWLHEGGTTLPRVAGGFKALRQYCLQSLSDFATASTPWLLIGGRTGSGKTVVLEDVPGSIDLEGVAHHRGSAFGGYPEGQPTPINFENTLAQMALRHSNSVVVLEDEGSTIGRLGLPREWHVRMQETPLVQIEVDQQTRIDHIFAEYVGNNTTSQALRDQYCDALRRITRRLGGARADELDVQVRSAFESGSQDTHRGWIKGLLDSYYDPMYDYQLAKKAQRIVFRGNHQEVIEFARDYPGQS